ncbi:YdaS family helix-turn-helix protein [Stenotrophomonas pavanii]
MTALDKAVQAAGSQQALAHLLGIKPPSVSGWYDRRRVPAERCIAIEQATGVSRHDLRPDVFGAAEPTGGQLVAETRALVDSRTSKRALRSRLGLSSDAHLAKVLGLPLEQVSGWADEDMVPALPQVMKLLGHPEQRELAKPANEDPDVDRIAPIEVA